MTPDTMTPDTRDDILEVIDAFIDTNPEFEGKRVSVSSKFTSENGAARAMLVNIDGETFVVTCNKV